VRQDCLSASTPYLAVPPSLLHNTQDKYYVVGHMNDIIVIGAPMLGVMLLPPFLLYLLELKLSKNPLQINALDATLCTS
jgi:hypothetical protein